MAPWVEFESYSIIVHISELGRYVNQPVTTCGYSTACLAIYTRLEACCSITGVGPSMEEACLQLYRSVDNFFEVGGLAA